MIHVTFVCLGNICRSPMAQSIFQYLVDKEGLTSYFHIDSAATSRWEIGNPIYPKTISQLQKNHIPVVNHVSRQIEEKDNNTDYLIGMEHTNITNIKKLIQNQNIEIKRLLEYANLDKDIADPWYTDDFETTYQEVMTGCTALLSYIRKKHKI